MSVTTINLEPIKDRQPIDAIATGDFFLVGDASDGGKVKPAIIDGLDLAPNKLAIADYDWETIPNKPLSFTPSIHGHAISEIDGLQAELDALESSSEIIKLPTPPAQRANGQPLQIYDLWLNTLSGEIAFWNGVLWLSIELYVYAATGRGGVSNNANYWCPVDLPVGADGREKKFFIESVSYRLGVAGTVNNDNYFVLTGRVRYLSTAEAPLDIVSPNLNQSSNAGQIEINSTLPPINPVVQTARATLGVRLSSVGSPTVPQALSFSYFIRWVLS